MSDTRSIYNQLETLRSEFENEVIELAKVYLRKMHPLETQGKALDAFVDFALESDFIIQVIDEYFQRGFNRDDVLSGK